MKVFRFYIPAAVWTVIIFLLCLMPASDIPNTTFSKIPYFDKLVHAGIFAGFVFLWAFALYKSGKSHHLVYLAIVILIAISLGFIIEILQKELISLHRDFDLWDWVADSLGAFFGGAVFNELFRGERKHAEG